MTVTYAGCDHLEAATSIIPVIFLPLTIFSDLHFLLLTFSVSICSNRGECKYVDPSSNVLSMCTIFDVTCTASCICKPGFGGADCSLSTAVLNNRDNLRYVACYVFS